MMKLFEKTRRVLLLLTFLLFNCRSGLAQAVHYDTYLDGLSSSFVLSLDEFIQRFNAEEFHPDINTENKANLRTRSILTLFDWQMFQLQDSCFTSQIISFVDTVSKQDVRLNMEKEGLYAEACCLFSYKQQEIPINLVLVFENIRDDYYKWAVAGANGLKECKLFDTVCNGYINPVQHDVHFSELSSACDALDKYISINRTVDQLSFIIGMLKTGELKFEACNKILFHFTQVPGFIFVVDKINRLDFNSGYLINKPVRADGLKKQSYIEQLLGKK